MSDPTEKELQDCLRCITTEPPCTHHGCATIIADAFKREKSRREEAEKAYLHTPVGHIVENLQKELTRLKAELAEAIEILKDARTFLNIEGDMGDFIQMKLDLCRRIENTLSAKGGGAG